MLGAQEIETIRAALRYWQEEITPHGDKTWRPYFDRADVQPLSGAAIEQLRSDLATCIRYAIYDPVKQQLFKTELWVKREEAIRQAGSRPVATVLIGSPAGS